MGFSHTCIICGAEQYILKRGAIFYNLKSVESYFFRTYEYIFMSLQLWSDIDGKKRVLSVNGMVIYHFT